MNSILKALKNQAGKPFKVLEEVQLVPGWDHYNYSKERKEIVPTPEPQPIEVDVQEVGTDQHVADIDQHIEEVITSEPICEPPKEESSGPDLAACMAEGFQKVVAAVQAIKIETPTIVSPAPVESLLKHSTQPQKPHLRKSKIKVTARDQNGNIDTIDIQDY
jgi:hypothetical protein